MNEFMYLFIVAGMFSLNFKSIQSTITVFDDKNTTLTTFDDLTAGFGPRISDDGFEGYITLAKPIGGCTEIERPPNVSYVDPKKWIALIQRTPNGNCSFDVKVLNAQKAGYSAVIIYNSDSDNLIKMSSSGKYSIKIPSVFVGHSTGLEISYFFTYENKTYVLITNDDTDLNYLLLPFVTVVSICFIVAICIFLIKFVMHCHKAHKNRFPKSALKKIPTKKYQKTDKYDTCPICLNEYEEGVKIRLLPCEHVYHIECIDKWLLRNNRFCPVCKRRVLPGGSDSESEDGDNHGSTNRESTNTNSYSETSNDRRNSALLNEPNEDEDTNESSRLLVNVRLNSVDDTSSVNTTNTFNNTLNNNNRNNNELSSLNNQMTTSINSGTNQLLSSTSQMPSKYGSISSINLLNTNSNILIDPNSYNNESNENEYENYSEADEAARKIKKSNVDSKSTADVAVSSSPFTMAPITDANLQLKTINSDKNNPKSNSGKKITNKNKQINQKNLNKIAAKLEASNTSETDTPVAPSEETTTPTTSSSAVAPSTSAMVNDGFITDDNLQVQILPLSKNSQSEPPPSDNS